MFSFADYYNERLSNLQKHQSRTQTKYKKFSLKIIQFKSKSTFSSFLGKEILIGSQSFTLKDANEYYKSKDKGNSRPFTLWLYFL